jgi:hypothetical protein
MGTFQVDDHEDVLDVEEEPAWTAGRCTQRNRSGEENRLIYLGRAGIWEYIEQLRGYAADG